MSSLRDDSKEIKDLLNPVLVKLSQYLDRVDHIVAQIAGDVQASSPVPSPPKPPEPIPPVPPAPSPPIIVPTPPPPAPAPHPTSPADSGDFPWVPHVKWTTFGTAGDERRGHWRETAYGWFKCSTGSGMHDAFCALPFPVQKGDAVDVRRPDGRVVTIVVGDKGPWNVSDRYMPKGARPQAESGTDTQGRETNRAGIDFTPAAAHLVDDRAAEDHYVNDHSGYVDVRWRPLVKPAGQVMSNVGLAIAKAAADLVGHPFQYLNPVLEEQGALGCADVVSTALIHAGVLTEAEHMISVSTLSALLRGDRHRFVEARLDDDQAGDIIEFGPRPGQKHGHIGVRMGDGTFINNSSSQKAVVRTNLAGYDRPIVRVMRTPKGIA